MAEFTAKLTDVIKGRRLGDIHLILDDPAGNSYLQVRGNFGKVFGKVGNAGAANFSNVEEVKRRRRRRRRRRCRPSFIHSFFFVPERVRARRRSRDGRGTLRAHLRAQRRARPQRHERRQLPRRRPAGRIALIDVERGTISRNTRGNPFAFWKRFSETR